METNVPLSRRRRETAAFGLLFGIIAALVIFGYGAARGFQVSHQTNPGPGWLVDIAFFAFPLLAGLLTTLRTGRTGSGSLAGLLTGLLGGLSAAAYILIIYYTASSVATAIRSIQDQLKQASINFTITPDVVQTFVIVATIIVVLLFLGFGALFGLVGAAIGKIVQPRPKFR